MISDEHHKAILACAEKLTNPRLQELLAQGKSFEEITQTIYNDELAAHSAGPSPHV
jgi:hypothetical protein